MRTCCMLWRTQALGRKTRGRRQGLSNLGQQHANGQPSMRGLTSWVLRPALMMDFGHAESEFLEDSRL